MYVCAVQTALPCELSHTHTHTNTTRVRHQQRMCETNSRAMVFFRLSFQFPPSAAAARLLSLAVAMRLTTGAADCGACALGTFGEIFVW